MALNDLNQLLAEAGLLPLLQSRQPRMAYWKAKHSRKMFGYNIEPLAPRPEHQNKKWCAVIYKSVKNGWQLTKERYFRKRNSAKACAYKWYKTNERRKEKRKQHVSMPMPQ